MGDMLDFHVEKFFQIAITCLTANIIIIVKIVQLHTLESSAVAFFLDGLDTGVLNSGSLLW